MVAGLHWNEGAIILCGCLPMNRKHEWHPSIWLPAHAEDKGSQAVYGYHATAIDHMGT